MSYDVWSLTLEPPSVTVMISHINFDYMKHRFTELSASVKSRCFGGWVWGGSSVLGVESPEWWCICVAQFTDTPTPTVRRSSAALVSTIWCGGWSRRVKWLSCSRVETTSSTSGTSSLIGTLSFQSRMWTLVQMTDHCRWKYANQKRKKFVFYCEMNIYVWLLIRIVESHLSLLGHQCVCPFLIALWLPVHSSQLQLVSTEDVNLLKKKKKRGSVISCNSCSL